MSTVTLAPRVAPARRTAAAPTAARRPAGSVRLTRRGRLLVFVLALLAVVAAALWLAAGSAASRDAGAPAEVDVVTVAPGDTLWDIASDAAATTGDDVRDMMQRIEQLNALDGGTVYVGQDLRVPAEG
ncbi:LysM peptidoglycan-binding domain-containing protein [Pimelobacter simplex]|uniref:LysM peptidoglycan-binding domain-containing protein n=1 Tax=Nocardioides simplex TaxID=2045 RepID=UPI003AAA88A4